MKILFLGDSITQGCGASSPELSYPFLTAKNLNAEFINYGVSGTRIARQNQVTTCDSVYNYDFNLRFEIMDRKADIVVVFGGTNDFGHGCAPLGSENDKSVYTYSGALEVLFSNLSKTYGSKKIIVIVPIPRYNQDDPIGDGDEYKLGIRGTLSDYNKILVRKAKKHDFKVVDYSSHYYVPPKWVESELFLDGLHPNDKGHKFLADLLTEDIKSMLK